jgi:hypothetical protein
MYGRADMTSALCIPFVGHVFNLYYSRRSEWPIKRPHTYYNAKMGGCIWTVGTGNLHFAPDQSDTDRSHGSSFLAWVYREGQQGYDGGAGEKGGLRGIVVGLYLGARDSRWFYLVINKVVSDPGKGVLSCYNLLVETNMEEDRRTPVEYTQVISHCGLCAPHWPWY